MRHIVISGQSGSTLFFHIPHKWHDVTKTVTEHKMYVLIFSTNLPETFVLLQILKRDIINVHISVFM